MENSRSLLCPYYYSGRASSTAQNSHERHVSHLNQSLCLSGRLCRCCIVRCHCATSFSHLLCIGA